MATNGHAGEWKYGVGWLMNPRWEWFEVKEDGTGTIYTLRPADVLRDMNPMPQVNSNIQFTVKEDGFIGEIMCYLGGPVEEETEEEAANEGETDETG